jgi:hypothetical protein
MKTLSYLMCGAVGIGLALAWKLEWQDANATHRHTQSSPANTTPQSKSGMKPGYAEIMSNLQNNQAAYELTPAQLAAFVEQKHHSVGGLLAA